jgi:sugar lactone lactonase YvrE
MAICSSPTKSHEQVFTVDAGGTLSVAVASGVGMAAGLAVDRSGNLYVSDQSDNTVRKISPAGANTTFAGGGSAGPVAGPATASQLDQPTNLAVDSQDNLYIADTGNGVVEKVTTAGTLSIVAGVGSGTNPATPLDRPLGVAVDGSGNLFVTNSAYPLVYEVTPEGVLTTVAGRRSCVRSPVSGGPATSTTLYGPRPWPSTPSVT